MRHSNGPFMEDVTGLQGQGSDVGFLGIPRIVNGKQLVFGVVLIAILGAIGSLFPWI